MLSSYLCGKGTNSRAAICGAALSLSLGLPWPASASEEFRCGSHLVEAGMSLEKVREYCGEPTEQSADRWIYDRGSTHLLVVLHIEPDNTVGLIEAKPRP